MTKRKHKYSAQTTGLTIFSPSQVEIMLKALEPLDPYLANANKDMPNVEFAKDVVTLLRGKLKEMIRDKNYMAVFGLDSNEVLVLHGALMAFSFGLKMSEDTAKNKSMQMDCDLLIAHFAAIVVATNPVQLQA